MYTTPAYVPQVLFVRMLFAHLTLPDDLDADVKRFHDRPFASRPSPPVPSADTVTVSAGPSPASENAQWVNVTEPTSEI